MSAGASPGLRYDPPSLFVYPATLDLEWMAEPGAIYTVEATDDVANGTWVQIGQVNTAGMTQFSDAAQASMDRRYYRLRLIP